MAITGHSGSVTVGGTAVGGAKIFSLTLTQDTVETTNFGSGGYKESTPTLKGGSGSVTAIFDGGADSGQASLIAGVTSGSSIALVLKTGATGAGTSEQYSFDANVTDMSFTNDVSGIIEATFSFETTGAITAAALPA